jgi:RHS repeat-associated protein
VLAEYTSSGNVVASYVYADDLISMSRGGQNNYYHFDGLGSTRLLMDASGIVTDTYNYDAFGNQIAHTGTTVNEFMFTGQQYDANVGFYYLRARYYQPDTGRFTSLDPFAGDPYAPASLHKYSYTENDPINKLDPSGEETLVDVGVVVALMSIMLTSLYVRSASLTKAQSNTQSDGDAVYRGLSNRSDENPFLVQLVGIMSKGMFPYSQSEHIESTKDDSMWISTSRSKEIAFGFSKQRHMIAVIDLNKIEQWRVFDTTKSWLRKSLSKKAQRISRDELEVSIILYINPKAILRVEKE